MRIKNKEIVILMYHRVNIIQKELCVTEENFKRQLAYLKKKNYNIISLDLAVNMIRTGEIKKKSIVLTFDDGYEDFYTNAWPLLKQYGYSSIAYIVPGYIESSRVFPWDKDLGESRLMNWSQIIALNQFGLVSFGSHSQNHYDLDKLDCKCVEYELGRSKQIIEEKLGKEIKHFSYPRGIYTQLHKRIVQDMYDTGVLIFDGDPLTNTLSTDSLMRLKRIPVQRSDGYLLFVARIKGWLVMEEILKRFFSKH